MANRTVQIISQQYGIGTIANAASEETLRELLKAINEFDDEINNNSPGSNTAEKNTSKNTLSKLGRVTSGVKNTVSGMKNTGAAFTNLLSKGSTNLSEYGQALSDNLIKGLPIFGQALGSLADGLIATVAIFESWNATLKTTAQVGASFNNSIVDLRLSAAKAQMPLDEFAKLITTNSQDFLILGGTVTQGAKTFTNFVDQLYREGTGILESMSYLGYSGSETSIIFFKYVTTTMRGHKLNMNNYGGVIERFKEYNKHMERLKNISGRSRESIEDMTKKVTDDELFKLRLSELKPAEQDKVKKVLETAVVVTGETGANLVDKYVNNVKLGNAGLNDFNTYMPSTAKALTEMMEQAMDTTVTTDKFSEFNEEALVNLIMSAKKDTDRIRKMFASEDQMPPEALAVYKRTGEFLAKFGNLDKLTPASIRARLAAQKKEFDNIEELTKILRDFAVTIRRFNSDLMKAIGPGLKKIGESMEKNKVNERVQAFGDWIGIKMTELIPKVFKFFENLGNPEFRRQLGNEFAYDIAIALERLKGVIGRAMIPGMIGREYQKRQEQKAIRLELAQQETAKSAAAVDETGTAVTPRRPQDFKQSSDRQYLRESTDALVQEMRSKGVKIKAPFPGNVVSELAGEAEAGKFGINRTGTEFKVGSGTNVLAIMGGEIQYTTLGGKPAAIIYDEKSDTSIVYRNLATTGKDKEIMDGLIAFYSKRKTVGENQLIGIVDTPYVGDGFGAKPSTTSMLQLEVRKGRQNPNKLFGGWGKYVDPETLMQYKNGTLGDMSKGFGNAGKLGTTVALHGTEAVVSPEQLSSSLTSIGQISLAEFITSLNSNVNLLISLTREDIRVERSKLSAQEKMKLSH
jgi:hypothetical protein